MTWGRRTVLLTVMRWDLILEGRTMATRWKFQQGERFQFKEELSNSGAEWGSHVR